MAETDRIGLADLIGQIKQELLEAPLEKDDVPLFYVDSIDLELQVLVKREGRGGIKIYVLELGGGGSRDDVQTVKVTLSPLLSKAQLLELYKKRHPNRLAELVEKSLEGITKTVDDGTSLSDQF